MLTQTEIQQLNKLASEFITEVQNAIKNKPIERTGRRQGQPYNFSSVANATGKLHDSLASEIYENGIRVTAFHYIEFLIYGRKPGKMPPVTAIEQWQSAKGVGGDGNTIAQSIGKYGTTIWQRFQGAESNFLEDINLDDLLSEFEQKYAGILETKLFNEVFRS